ncbi:bromodomain and WD repeat-containing protein 3 isoform X2 [Sitodiplosis mosellana]|uniref:bromodomain and WD repeat-containing protein 3 isoform X2 n=1 Tax=Sitodiplosis mosellana TaxID=263140 RepID=UPI0024438EF6|nr:bromodomain and WD repeat-containing protein 3 isoform X2 [Sitodiplosis mosellana]
MDNRAIENNIVAEIYFLISKFLANGPFKHVGEVLIREIEEQQILPSRLDWQGKSHEQTYNELERQYAHIGPNHLVEICARVTTLLDRQMTPSVAGIQSLLGAGRQSALRSETNSSKPKSLVDYCTRIHSMPLLDSNRKFTHNLVKVLYGRESSGSCTRKLAITNQFYSKAQLQRRTLGHLSAVYCVLFDRSGKYIITGADDLLVKLWSAIDGRLLCTFRGASAEITDIAVNLENTLLAAGSLDHIVRVWDLQTASPVAVLCGHTGRITSVNFCPSPREHLKYLVTTSTDGSVAFYQYATSRDGKTNFAPKPTQYHEKMRPGQAQMMNAAFSPGGHFLAAGSADHNVRVYHMAEDGPKRILETEAHSDTVDSIQWAHNSLRYVSGSKDGTALVWHFERQQWKSMRLEMTERLPTCPTPTEKDKKSSVTMVGWDLTDEFVFTAVNDFTIKVWNAATGKLHRVMRGHTDELYVLESHPKDAHILMSAGHDGKMIIWDVKEGVSLVSFTNLIDGQGHGGLYDAKWSPDGTMIAATDSHGHMLMYGFGDGHKRLKELPPELFFHTDYRPLIRDTNHFVLDEQTQTAPHLMPPPFLVDVDGNPYPPPLQKLVPGRESCSADQLVPNISVGPEGIEVVEGNAVSHIDRLIAALANRHGAGGMADVGTERNGNVDNQNIDNANLHGGNVGGAYQLGVAPAAAAAAAAQNRLINGNEPNAANAEQNAEQNGDRLNQNRIAARRIAEEEGIRRSVGNWQSGIKAIQWFRRYVRPMPHSRLQMLRNTVYVAGQQELEHYKRELRRKPIMINTATPSSSSSLRGPHVRGRRAIGRTRSANTLQSNANQSASRATYRTRAVHEREQQDIDDDEEDDHSATSVSSDSSDGTLAEDQLSSSSDTDDTQSSDYSDWVNPDAEQATLVPPKRSRRKRAKPRSYSPSEGPSSQVIRGIGRRNLPIGDNNEIPENFRPPEWLSEVIPRKAPYYPQMGDEVVYFRQGHKLYLEAVNQKNVYKVVGTEPWVRLDLRDYEFVKVIGIKYEIKPPRLCCLKLALMNNDGTLKNQTFTIKYHDMPDVLDFLVLKQTYDTAVRRLWTTGDRFRCMIDDGWWIGQITGRVPYSDEFPDSLFMCFQIRWDSGETERMSPWDMEPIDNSRMPNEVGGVVHVQGEELQMMLYQPTSEEWPRGDRDGTCRRIVAGLEEVMGLAIADPFLVPVDLNIYPSYAFVVEYPIDLTTIKARFENHFYRRIASAQFDVRYLATNAEKFNQSDSHIVKNARIITDLCLRIIQDSDIDVNAVYHQLVATYTSDSDDQNPGTSTGHITPSGRRRSRRNAALNSSGSSGSGDWRDKCRQVLEIIWNHEDSEPFREPVDTIDHPDYLQVIDTPMDLRTVKEDLLGSNYQSKMEFLKDVRMIFTNSRHYNTNPRSRIYTMTLRLSNLFEEQMKKIFKRSSSRLNRSNRSNRGRNERRRNGASTSHAHTNDGPSTSRTYTRVRRHSSDEEQEVDVMNGETPSTSTGRPMRQIRVRQTNRTANGVSSSNNEAGPSGFRNKRTRQLQSDNGMSEQSSESSESESSNESENYDPNEPKSSRKTKTAKKKEQRTNGTNSSKRPRRLVLHESSDDEQVDEEPPTVPVSSQNGKRARGRPRKNQISDDESEGDGNESEAEEQSDDQSEEQSEEEAAEQDSYRPKRMAAQQSLVRSTRRSSRRNQSDDSDTPLRPRRNTSKRVQEDDSYDESEITTSSNRRTVTNPQEQRTRTRRQMNTSPDHEESIHEESVRPTRSTRHTLNSIRNNGTIAQDSEEDSDDEVLSHIARQNRPKRSPRGQSAPSMPTSTEFVDTSSPIHLNGTPLPRTREMIRRKQSAISTSSTSAVVSASSPTGYHSVTRSMTTTETTSQIEIRRNQVQEDHNYGEPGPSTLRYSRRTQLSRLQRSTEELDKSVASNADCPVDPLRIPESISGRLRNRTPRSNAHVDNENDSDPDDDKPLHLMVTESPTRGRSSRHPTRYSDEHVSQSPAGSSSVPTSSTRSGRTQKRPYYNEESDEEESHRSKRQTTQGRTTWNSSGSGNPTTRREVNKGQYFEGDSSNSDFDENDDEEEAEEQISISSRGRVRKISSKMKKIR